MNGRVLIGMSGGVDSSVAAMLLCRQGYEVHGFTLKMWSEDGRCCSKEDIQAAMAVARRLGIPHAIIDIREQFKKEVVSYFLREYRAGRTPNPCAFCNRRIRFGEFLKRVEEFGASYLATGHYARIKAVPLPSSQSGGELLLARAEDGEKSQEYFLGLIPRRNLSRILFPLGDLTKNQVRALAHRNRLPVRERESQDVCFIPDGDTAGFLRERLGSKPGEVVDTKGKILGRHQGIWAYTVGQRKGLGISADRRLYVVFLDPAHNRVILGERSALSGSKFQLRELNLFTRRDLTSIPLSAKIRYASPRIPCRLEGSRVILDESVDAITPGQLGVLYWEDKVVAGGIITNPG